ncbi:tRNA (adenosine(37)-N6)-threonylcarbamoyltransferase complex ATPase subunit type 1 TsaE [Henriciella sp. AS95]|uniref:tRNA (adenosine(37)-N6)-threonylcarbamoyltransferase complex ATPase subunit type 1 TsaE n=1 Tax=Henriciella sp. AS95 TaxID=3135782 RepID=UPI00316DF962
MDTLEFHLADEAATDRLARRLAPHLQAGDVIALHGGLGAGKTTFSRSLISALLGAKTEVPSPTYTLVQTYDGPDFPIFHFDLYRLDEPGDVMELGWEDTMDGLSLIEWPGKAGDYLPAWRLDLTLEQTVDGRTARLVPHGEDWQTRLHGI